MYSSGRRIKEFENRLDKEGTALNVRLEFDANRKLAKFSLNLTAMAGGKIFEIARYDCGHGYLHMHRFYRKPPTREIVHMEISVQTTRVLRQEILGNWKSWKRAFLENYGVMG